MDFHDTNGGARESQYSLDGLSEYLHRATYGSPGGSEEKNTQAVPGSYVLGVSYMQDSPHDSIDDLLVGKAAFLGQRVEQLALGIEARQKLMDESLQELLYDECHVDSRIYHLLQLRSEWFDSHTLAQKKASLYTRLAQITKERRDQKVDAWADISRMQKELFETSQEYEAAKRREGLWAGDAHGY